MNDVQGASTVKNVSLKSAKIILSTVVNVYADYQDHIFPKEEMGNYLKKIASNLSNRCFVYKRLSREGFLLSITPRRWEVKKQDGDESAGKTCPPSRKLRRAAELYGNKNCY